eukprot:scaffold46200_cov66-Phaeocystis_antarctica.AAC.6
MAARRCSSASWDATLCAIPSSSARASAAACSTAACSTASASAWARSAAASAAAFLASESEVGLGVDRCSRASQPLMRAWRLVAANASRVTCAASDAHITRARA